ncbi:MAG: glycoside hydrolase family 125 protein, partial [Bacteroidota bacterium]
SQRPSIEERKFTSEAVELTITEVKQAIADVEIAWMFENCLPNTLDTTIRYEENNGRPDTYIITGDIDAMWLRDSTAQVWPYLPLAAKDEKLKKLIAGVINRQTKYILIDPYANAFNYGNEGSEWESDFTEMKPGVHERKWEIDSLCYAIHLSNAYWEETGDTSCFNDDWIKAMKLLLQTFVVQQRKDGLGPYKFQRANGVATDTLPLGGYGNPTKPIGLIHSGFRPSDDACIYSYLIPSNLFAVVKLKQLAVIFSDVLKDEKFAEECITLANEIDDAVKKYAVSEHLNYGKIYAYEVDGFGNQLFMDDTNVPALFSLPYLGYCDIDDEIYLNTRRYLQSEDHPYFFKGKFAEGIGGPHIGLDMVWPMNIIIRALTTQDEEEIKLCIKMLKETHAGTGFIHESFHKDDPNNFTRSWFAWANTLFGELILNLYKTKPHLLEDKY